MKQSEIEIRKYNTLKKIIEQLEWCEYENQAGCLKNNVAFIALKRMEEKEVTPHTCTINEEQKKETEQKGWAK